jgi:hypothetical protein
MGMSKGSSVSVVFALIEVITSRGWAITDGATSYSTVYCVRQADCGCGGSGCDWSCLARYFGVNADTASGKFWTQRPKNLFMVITLTTIDECSEAVRAFLITREILSLDGL